MTVEPTPAEQIDRMQKLAENIWGDEYTLQLKLWTDGEYQIIAYHVELDQGYQEDITHTSGKQPYDKALYSERKAVEGEGAPHSGELIPGTAELQDLPP